MRAKNIKGFTLVEALLASFIMAVGLFAAGTAIYSQFFSLNQNREKAIATLAAQEEVESIRGMPFDTIVNLPSSFTAGGFTYLNSPVGTVTVSSSYGDKIKKISVTVTWSSLTGQTLQKSLVTLVTKNGINKQ